MNLKSLRFQGQKLDGLKVLQIDSDKAIEFFTVHEEADVYHSKDEMDIMVKVIIHLEDQKRLINTVDESCNINVEFSLMVFIKIIV